MRYKLPYQKRYTVKREYKSTYQKIYKEDIYPEIKKVIESKGYISQDKINNIIRKKL